jgi:sterol desaturase/sphingolipid hydroxylase (fatty acid hydroxylase superfamily)
MSDPLFPLLRSAVAVPGLFELFLSLLAVAAVLIPLERLAPARRLPFPARRTLLLNLAYWFFTPVFTKALTAAVLGGVLLAAFTVQGRSVAPSLLDGFGPLARQPLWLQTVEILLLADFIDYWTHRTFHTSRLWRFHAVHHSAEEMTWLAAGRMHPVNDLVTRVCQVVPLVLAGFSPKGVMLAVPYLVFYVILLHSNLKWDFGPLRYVLVSPAYHRWHHTSDAEGIDKNFAGIFPVWDLLFGTCHFPRREPAKFGVHRDPVPETLWGQLAYPFRRGGGG